MANDNIIMVQLSDLLAQVEARARDGANLHWRIGEELNELRDVVQGMLSGANRDLFEKLSKPIDVRQPRTSSDGEYTLSGTAALRLAQQLHSFASNELGYEDPSRAPEDAELLGRVVPDTHQVFIVHGHDQANALRLQRLVSTRYNLDPVVLSERASRGRTILEKFEEEAGCCAYAFALITPDDFVQVGESKYAQARPNVLFEIGWFYGRLGRDRVSLVCQRGTKIPSDLDGIGRIQFTSSIEEALIDIERELQAVGMLEQGED